MITKNQTKYELSSPYKILIVSSCTKDKAFPPHLPSRPQIQADQLWDEKDDDRTLRDFGELEQYRVPAAELYRGLQHTELMQAVKFLRRALGQATVSVKIISAGFGVVDEQQWLPPYEATFADQPRSSILALAQRLRIPQAINELMSGSYDCAFFLLGETYLLSLDLPFDSDPPFPCFFLASPASSKYMPKRPPYYLISAGKDESIAFSYNLVGLKGHLFRLFAEQIVTPKLQALPLALQPSASAHERLQSFFLMPTPQCFLSVIQPGQRSHRATSQPSLGQVTQLPLFTFAKTSGKRARNYGRPMRFFLPDWDDRVDPGYDFERDLPAPEKRAYDGEVYAHEIYEQPNYDGLLFSKSTVEHGLAKVERIQQMGGIHKYARFEGKPILGDCGAFSYIAEKDPPYQTREILDYYESYGFTYGVSIDHLIIPAVRSAFLLVDSNLPNISSF